MDSVEKIRQTLEQQTLEVRKEVEEKLSHASAQRDEMLRNIVDRLKKHVSIIIVEAVLLLWTTVYICPNILPVTHARGLIDRVRELTPVQTKQYRLRLGFKYLSSGPLSPGRKDWAKNQLPFKCFSLSTPEAFFDRNLIKSKFCCHLSDQSHYLQLMMREW